MTNDTFTDNNSTQFDYERFASKNVIDANGNKVGGVGQIYLDDQTSRPKWITVQTGFLGSKEKFVPLQNADLDGDDIQVPYTKDQIKDAPDFADDGHISESDEDELFRYYGNGSAANVDRNMSAPLVSDGNVRHDDLYDRDGSNEDRDLTHGGRLEDDRLGNDRLASAGTQLADGDIVLHEERVNVDKEQVETGRVQLNKHVETEQQTFTVPVTHEELRVERTPLETGQVNNNHDLGEDSQEIILHEERPVISKETVGVERVSVQAVPVTENQTVTTDVSKERIDVVQDGQMVDDHTGMREDTLPRNNSTLGLSEEGNSLRDRGVVNEDRLNDDLTNRSSFDGNGDNLNTDVDRNGDGHVSLGEKIHNKVDDLRDRR